MKLDDRQFNWRKLIYLFFISVLLLGLLLVGTRYIKTTPDFLVISDPLNTSSLKPIYIRWDQIKSMGVSNGYVQTSYGTQTKQVYYIMTKDNSVIYLKEAIDDVELWNYIHYQKNIP